MAATQSSSGYIVEFNQETGLGVIEEQTTKRSLLVQRHSFKKNARRYLSTKNSFTGELFDFDVVARTSTDGTVDEILEAVNIRHRILKCTVEGCTRLKAFTHLKALEEHVLIRHTLKKNKAEEGAMISTEPLKKKKPKRARRPRPERFQVHLSSTNDASVTGRFIGKQGENLKRLEARFNVQLQLLNNRSTYQPAQILVKPKSSATIDIELITKVLQSQWQRCVQEQRMIEKEFHNRRRMVLYQRQYIPQPEFDRDSRYRDETKYRLRRAKRQFYAERKKLRQTESSIRMEECHAPLNREGRRCISTCDSESRLKSIFNYQFPKKNKCSSRPKSCSLDRDLDIFDLLVTT